MLDWQLPKGKHWQGCREGGALDLCVELHTNRALMKNSIGNFPQSKSRSAVQSSNLPSGCVCKRYEVSELKKSLCSLKSLQLPSVKIQNQTKCPPTEEQRRKTYPYLPQRRTSSHSPLPASRTQSATVVSALSTTSAGN